MSNVKQVEAAWAKFNDIDFIDSLGALLAMHKGIAAGGDPDDVLRQVECEFVQRVAVRLPTPRTPKERGRINRKVSDPLNVLEKAKEVLRELQEEHLAGEDWVDLDDANTWGVSLLERMGVLECIFIDGRHRGQIKGAIK